MCFGLIYLYGKTYKNKGMIYYDSHDNDHAGWEKM